MVRMVYMNDFYETSLQISDPNIEFSTKTYFFENWPCPKFLEEHAWTKKIQGVPPQQNKGCKYIPEYSRAKSDHIIYKNTCVHNEFIVNQQFQMKIAVELGGRHGRRP